MNQNYKKFEQWVKIAQSRGVAYFSCSNLMVFLNNIRESFPISRESFYAWIYVSNFDDYEDYNFKNILRHFKIKKLQYPYPIGPSETGAALKKKNWFINEEKRQEISSAKDELIKLKDKTMVFNIETLKSKAREKFKQQHLNLLSEYKKKSVYKNIICKICYFPYNKLVNLIMENEKKLPQFSTAKDSQVLIILFLGNKDENTNTERECLKENIREELEAHLKDILDEGNQYVTKTIKLEEHLIREKLKNEPQDIVDAIYNQFFAASSLKNNFNKDNRWEFDLKEELKENKKTLRLACNESVLSLFEKFLINYIDDLIIEQKKFAFNTLFYDLSQTELKYMNSYLYENYLDSKFKKSPYLVFFKEIQINTLTKGANLLVITAFSNNNKLNRQDINKDLLDQELKRSLSEKLNNFKVREVNLIDNNMKMKVKEIFINTTIERNTNNNMVIYAFGQEKDLSVIDSLFQQMKDDQIIKRKTLPFIKSEEIFKKKPTSPRQSSIYNSKYSCNDRSKTPEFSRKYENYTYSRISPLLTLKIVNSDLKVLLCNGDVLKNKGFCLIVPVDSQFIKSKKSATTGIFYSILEPAESDEQLKHVNKKILETFFKKNSNEDFVKNPRLVDIRNTILNYEYLLFFSVKNTPVNIHEKFSEEIKVGFNCCLKTILTNFDLRMKIDIVCPLISAGVHSRTAFSSLSSILLGLNSGYAADDFTKEDFKFINSIQIIELDQSKIKTLAINVKEIINSTDSKFFQWYWNDKDKSFKKYDCDTNRAIEEAFQIGEKKMSICFPPLHGEGTHQINFQKNKMKNIALREKFTIGRNKDGRWHFFEQNSSIARRFDKRSDEIIETSYQKKEKQVTIFLNRYEVIFGEMVQKNVETNFKRKIKRTECQEENYNYGYNFKENCQIIGSITTDNIKLNFESRKKEDYPTDSRVGDKKVEFKFLSRGSKWDEIEKNFKNSLPKLKISKIKEIHNNMQEFSYNCEKKKMKTLNEHQLWHGTDKASPEDIINDDVGFRINYASDDSSYGRGLYFAENAEYSDKFAFQQQDGSKVLIFAKVLLGEQQFCRNAKKFKNCPEGFDSIKGKANSQVIHILYDHSRAIPKYLVYYR